MSNENEIKHDQITYNIKLTSRIIQWMDFLHKTDDIKINDFLKAVYGEDEADGYLEEKRNYLRNNGVWAWMHKLDNRNSTRFYNLVMKDDPTNWWMGYSIENRKAMQDMIEDAIEQVTDRLETEVNTISDVLDDGPTAEDLGAEPRETFDDHRDDE